MDDALTLNYKNVGLRLPNGKVKVLKSEKGDKGRIFESADDFYKEYQSINEGSGEVSCFLMDMILEGQG